LVRNLNVVGSGLANGSGIATRKARDGISTTPAQYIHFLESYRGKFSSNRFYRFSFACLLRVRHSQQSSRTRKRFASCHALPHMLCSVKANSHRRSFWYCSEGYKEARLERAQQRFLDTLSRETGIPLWRQQSSTHRTSQFKLRDRVRPSSNWVRTNLTTSKSQPPMFG